MDYIIRPFDQKLKDFVAEFKSLQEEENQLKIKAGMANERFQAWLKEIGLPENFTLAQLMELAVRKARE